MSDAIKAAIAKLDHEYTFNKWWEEFESVHPDWRFAESGALRKRAFEAGQLEAAEHILEMWREPWPVTEARFIDRLNAYVEGLK